MIPREDFFRRKIMDNAIDDIEVQAIHGTV